MCGVIATSPRGRTVWEGFVQEVTTEIDGTTTTISLADMANQIVVRYKDTAGAQVSGTPVTDAASIARYGTKTRLINFATTTPTAATNRAGVVLKQIGNPRSKRRSARPQRQPQHGLQSYAGVSRLVGHACVALGCECQHQHNRHVGAGARADHRLQRDQ